MIWSNEDDRYYDRMQDDPPRRCSRGCWCNLDGYPGTCPSAENCPYSGYRDNEEEGLEE